MRRLFVVLLVPVVLAAVAPAAPVPKHLMKGPVYYYPTTVGTKLVYEDSDGEESLGEETLVIVKVENAEGVKEVTVEKLTPTGSVRKETMAVSANGHAMLDCGGAQFDSPIPVLKTPFRVGDTWEVKAAGLVGTNTIGAIEKLKVPAGTFDTVRVDWKYTFQGIGGEATFWYAVGVGLVKMKYEKTRERVLRSFTPVKE